MATAEYKLSLVMKLIGYTMIFAPVPFIFLLKSGWRWYPNQVEYEWMVIVIYTVLGIFLVIGASDLANSKLLIDFTIWGAFVAHATVMVIEAALDWEAEWSHVSPWGDCLSFYLFAAVMLYLRLKVDFAKL